MSLNFAEMNFAEIYSALTKRWLSPDDLEKEYGISKSTQSKMRMLSSSSLIPYSKVGRYVRYDRIAIDQWLQDHRI